MAGAEAGGGVEAEGGGVGFGDGESEGSVVAVGEVLESVAEELAAEALSAAGGVDAELGDVGGVGCDAGTEQDGGEGAGGVACAGTVDEREGAFGVEGAAAGEANDVVEEAEGAGEGAVLVVDFGVDVAEVGEVDELGGGVVEGGLPGAELYGGGKGLGGQGEAGGG